jgi:Fungal chitosanase of glycosyl hydrolase group 75
MTEPLPPLNSDGSYTFLAGMSIDADGANGADGSGRAAYGPPGTDPLDYLANAGHEGNWWGIVTVGGRPVIQHEGDPAPGYYVSTTSYQREGLAITDPARYLDSATELFIVVPNHWRMLAAGIVLGCRAVVHDSETGREAECIVGDFGPRSHLGEGSIALAKWFGLNADPKRGGVEEHRFCYTFYPGSSLEGYELQPA